MKRIFLSVFLLPGMLLAQSSYLTFEDANLPVDTFWNGSDTTSLYEEGVYQLECYYDTSFGGYWSDGIAISTMTDDSTGNFLNLYGSITGSGNNSLTYGVVNAGSPSSIRAELLSPELDYLLPRWLSTYVTNTTYVYTSMANGDQFAKKFGGASGDDPDYFFIRFYFSADSTTQDEFIDSVDFYLADFRFEDNSEDYILDDWVYVDLNDYPAYEYYGEYMSMRVFSSDVGQFGINTPAFFCIDDVEMAYPGGTEDISEDLTFDLRVIQQGFTVQSRGAYELQLRDMSGRLLSSSSERDESFVSTNGLSTGIYIVSVSKEGMTSSKKVWRW